MIRVGIIGIRGYRVIYSGFETFVKHLVEKSSKQKCYYYLFCRSSYQLGRHHNTNFALIAVPTIKNKYLETPFYSFFSTLIGLFNKLDVVLYLGLVHAPFIFIQKLLRREIIINVDGLDWQRKRWNVFGKIYLRFCELLTIVFADIIICDAETIYKRYKKNYPFKKIVFIPYGAEIKLRKPGKVLRKFGLKSKKYIHFVGRLTPENCVEDLIKAFRRIKTNYRCVIVGDSVYEDKYKDYLMGLAKSDKRIVFVGFLSGKDYEELCSNSSLYVETKEVGGTHPSLLEAIAFGNPIIAKSVSFHREILGRGAWYYTHIDNLAEKIQNFLSNPTSLIKKSIALKKNVKKLYSWETVIKQYEELFNR